MNPHERFFPAGEPVQFNPLAGVAPKMPPHNIEAEQALLGAILMNNEALDAVSDFLQRSHFFEYLHGQIFEACVKHIAAGRRATPITLKPFFEDEAPVGKQTVVQYLGTLVAHATTVINAKDYGRTIYDLAIRRELIAFGEDVVARAYSSSIEDEPDEQIQDAEKRLYQLGQYGVRNTLVSFGDAMRRGIQAAESAYMNGTGLLGLSTGINSLDGVIGGLAPGNVIVLAGRPSMGKSALAANIGFNIAKDAREIIIMADGSTKSKGCPVGFFSMEMTAEEVAMRSLSSETEINGTAIRQGRFDEDQFRAMLGKEADLRDTPLYIETSGGLSPQQLTTLARRMVRTKNIGFLIVDYLQLMRVSKADNRVAQMSEAMATFKPLAKELNIPIMVLSQLSRACESRDDKRPMLSDLRDSGSIEQDADVVLFVFREEYYVQRREPSITKVDDHQKWIGEMNACAGLAEVIQGKGRHTGTGKTVVRFDGQFCRFSDVV